jgi:Xaa-Pro aminopeptidase
MGSILAAVEADELDLILLHTSDNVYYVSGVPLLSEWGRPLWCAFRPNATGVLVGAEIERENMEQGPTALDVRCYGDHQHVGEASLHIVKDFARAGGRPVKRIGVERSLLSMELYEGLRAILPNSEFIDVGHALAETRLVKSEEELRILRLGGEIAIAGARAFCDALAPGVSELEVVSEALSEMNRMLAASWPSGLSSTYAYCQLGLNSLTPHLHPTGRKLRRGDLVALNVFPVLSGYCMELERTFVFGDAPDTVHRALDAVTSAFISAKARIMPGSEMASVDSHATEILRGAGLDQYIRHGTGHAHGIMIGAAGREELGELRSYNRRQLAPNMVCSVEPGVYIPGTGGFRHSDVMLVGAAGSTCLTDFPVTQQFAGG